jgi:hypothetical protein
MPEEILILDVQKAFKTHMHLQPKRIHVFLRDGHSPATIKLMGQSFTSRES